MPSEPLIPGGTVHIKFTTRATTGIPTILSGSPVVSIYKDGSTTESVAGVTLTANFDSVAGLNHVAIDTSADGTFYSAGSQFYAVITTGTVATVSVVGEVVGEFSLSAAVTIPTTAQIATAVWQDTTAGDFTVASSIGKSLYTAGVVPGGSGGLFIAGTNAATTVNITGTISTVTTVTNQLTAAQIATGVWQDATAGDFTTASSIGKALYIANVVPGAAGGHFIAGTNAATSITTALTANIIGNITGNLSGSVGSVTGAVGSVTAGVTVTTNNDKTGYTLTVTPPTAAAIATAIWTDTTAGDFTTDTSPGKIIFTQLGGAFTTTSSSIFSTASLANAPTGGSAPTAAQIATAVWQDTTAGDFTVASSIGKSLYTAGVVPGGTGGLFIAGTNAATTVTTSFTTTFTGNLTGSVGSLTLSQVLSAPRDVSAIADGAITLNDALWGAVCAAAGQETTVGLVYTVMTPGTGTTIRIFALDSATAPTSRL